jgi:hypothetical protein
MIALDIGESICQTPPPQNLTKNGLRQISWKMIAFLTRTTCSIFLLATCLFAIGCTLLDKEPAVNEPAVKEPAAKEERDSTSLWDRPARSEDGDEGRGTGLSDESRSIERRLGIK